MKNKKTLALLYGLEIILVIITFAFNLFTENISAFNLVSRFIFVMLLLLANFLVFLALINQKIWNHISWFMYFGFVIVSIYAVLIHNYALNPLTAVVAIGSIIILVLDMIMVISYEEPKNRRYTGHDLRQDRTLQYLKQENEMLKQMEEDTKKKLSYTSGALKADNKKLKEELAKVQRSVSRKASSKKVNEELSKVKKSVKKKTSGSAKTKKLEKELANVKRSSKASATKLQKELAKVKKSAKKRPVARKTKDEKHFIASKSGNTFHRPHCVSVNRISKKQVVWYDSAKKAQKAKYKPCKVCSPLSGKTKKKFFIANKDANKVHRATCLVADKIPKKKQVVFKKEEQALKKGYKPCKLCFPLAK